MPGHVVATGAGRTMMQRATDPTHSYILELTGKARPRVLFVGTATGDEATYALTFYETYHAERCIPARLTLFNRTVTDLADYVQSFDVIHVGGGNTANMLDVWRRQGLDTILRAMFESRDDVVMCGGSAGGICWFEGGTTDSYGPVLDVLPEGLGLVPGSFSPHYDAEDQRRPLYHAALLDGSLPAGYAVGNLQSVHFHGTEFVTAISPVPDPLAIEVGVHDGVVVETPLPVTIL